MCKVLPPKYLYKYKTISDLKDMDRLEDIIKNNRLYFPRYNKLNDPLEGQVIGLNSLGYAGSSMHILADEEDPIVVSEKKKYRILALSDSADSSLMWTHYANMFNGVCLCYSSKSCFSIAMPVIYKNSIEKYSYLGQESSDYPLSQIVFSGLFYKLEDWRYEHEWRIVNKSRSKYFQYGKTDLVGIIIGKNVSAAREKKIEKMIFESGNNSIHLFKACPGYRSLSINIFPINESGKKFERIDDIADYFDNHRVM